MPTAPARRLHVRIHLEPLQHLASRTADFDGNVGVIAAFATVSACSTSADATGLSIYEGSLSHCVADDNSNIGITVQQGEVDSCLVDSNLLGLLVNSQSNVHDNTVNFSKSSGIQVNGGESIVSDNTVSDSGTLQSASGVIVPSAGNRITHNTASGTAGPGIQVTGSFNTIDDNSTFVNTGIGIVVAGSKNTVVRNSSTGNVNQAASTNYSIDAANNAGPITAANAATNPWGNTQ